MIVIAKTEKGAILEGSNSEIRAILSSFAGCTVREFDIGQKIPAIDYAASISKIKSLKDNSNYLRIVKAFIDFNSSFNDLKKTIDDASLIEI